MQAMCNILAQCKFVTKDFCYVCQQTCPLLPASHSDAEHGEIAGTTCVAWSIMRPTTSVTKHWLHKSTLPCLVWIFWLAFAQPSWYIHECVSGFDCEELLFAVKKIYTSFSMVFTPKMFGVPANRSRRFTFGFNKLTFQLSRAAKAMLMEACGVGDEDDESLEDLDVQQRSQGLMTCFTNMFHRDVVAGSDVFLQAPCEMVAAYVRANSSIRSETGGDGGPTPGCPDMRVCLSGARFQRLIGYMKTLRENMGNERTRSAMVNLEQTSGFHSTVSDTCPALLTRSFLCRLTVKNRDLGLDAEADGQEQHPTPVRILLPLEHFAVLSFPIFNAGEWSGFFPWSISWLQKNIEELEIKRLTGNGMHLQAIGSILALIWSMCQPQPPGSQSPIRPRRLKF